MIRVAAIVMLSTMTTSCAYTAPYGGFFGFREPLRQPAAIAVPESYTKSEVDAINAETVCRLQSRNVLEASRCGIRRQQ
jgi:hypothetical protein